MVMSTIRWKHSLTTGLVNFSQSFHQCCKRFGKTLALMALGGTATNAQGGHPQPPPPPAGAKAAKCKGRPIPQLEDVTAKTGITFKHAADPAKKYIVESMSGGVIVFDYDRDGWPDIYFTNSKWNSRISNCSPRRRYEFDQTWKFYERPET
jgi:hypothetical protein